MAYTRYVIDAGIKGNIFDLYVALAPCSIGYAGIGRNLAADPQTRRQGNPFKSWIKLYSGAQLQQGAMQSCEQIDIFWHQALKAISLEHV